MTKQTELIVIGGSAGSLQPLLKILTLIKQDFSIPILLVLHRNSQYDSSLEDLLVSRIQLTPKEVEDKDPIKPGYVYIAPADYHVLVEQDKIFSLDNSEKVNFSRPSIDVVFSSAAVVFKEQLVAILLSGANTDGSDGVQEVKRNGGMVVIQDPEDATVAYMPQQAIKKHSPEHILSAPQIAGFLNSLIIQ